MRRTVIAALAIAATVSFAGCAADAKSSDAKADTSVLKVGTASESISFAPTGTDRLALTMVYDYLFTQKDGVYSPRAAESFSYDDGNTVLTIKLRDGLTFSDGTAIDAETIKADILWSKDNGAFFTSITKVEAVDAQTVRITQSQADHNVMLSLWAMPIMTVKTTEDPNAFATTPVSSGPYEVTKDGTVAGSKYSFVRNPDYWDAEAFPYDTVQLSLLPDDTSRINALKSGQVDVAPVSSLTADEAKSSGLTVNELTANFVGLILGDREGKLNKAIGDVRVRQAIAMSFDRESAVKALFNGYAVADDQPFIKGMTGYQTDDANAYAYDPEKAKKLLSEAGYPNGFTLDMPSYASITEYMQPFITQSLADIGITVNWVAQSDDSWLSAWSEAKFAAVPMSLPAAQTVDSANPDFFWNGWHNDDPDAVSLLATINSGTTDEAKKATEALGKIAYDDVWFAVFADPTTTWASTKDIVVNQPQYADWVLISDIAPVN